MARESSTSSRKRAASSVEETAASSRPKRATRADVGAPPGKHPRVSTSTDKKGDVPQSKAQTAKLGSAGKSKETASGNSTATAKKSSGEQQKKAQDPKANAPTVNGSAKASGDGKSFWLMKAEPESRFEKGVDVKFSIDDLREAAEPEPWDGVRNPAARNHMRSMKKGDLAFFYHSNCKTPGIVGVMEIVREHSVDESAFDPKHPYYDPKSDRENPKWEVVHVEFQSKFKDMIKLTDLKSHAKPGGALENLQMLKQSRLSVSSVSPEQWEFIMGQAEQQE